MVEIGLVDVQVHHAGIGPADLGQVGVPEAPPHLGGPAPVGDLRVHRRVAALHHAGDDRVTFSGPLQIRHHFAHGAAGIQLSKPGGGVCILIIRRLFLLEVHQHHRHVQIPHRRQHIVGGGVGAKLQDHQIHVGGPKLVSGLHGLLLGGDDAPVDQLHRIGDALLELLILARELRHQRGKLGQVRPQGDGEHADPCFGLN